MCAAAWRGLWKKSKWYVRTHGRMVWYRRARPIEKEQGGRTYVRTYGSLSKKTKLSGTLRYGSAYGKRATCTYGTPRYGTAYRKKSKLYVVRCKLYVTVRYGMIRYGSVSFTMRVVRFGTLPTRYSMRPRRAFPSDKSCLHLVAAQYVLLLGG